MTDDFDEIRNEPVIAPVRVQPVVRCPVCDCEMEKPLTKETCPWALSNLEKLWLCMQHGYLVDGRVAWYPEI